jgi:hypothetical protein
MTKSYKTKMEKELKLGDNEKEDRKNVDEQTVRKRE